MRFEIRGGGITAIVVGVTFLSGVVFVLGLMAGYDVGRQAEINSAPVASSYPLQAPPAATVGPPTLATAANPASAMSPTVSAAASSTAPSVEGRNGLAKGTAAAHEVVSNAAPLRAAPQAAAKVPQVDNGTTSRETENSQALGTKAANAAGNTAPQSRVASARAHRKPYNIRIEAAMDIRGADNMMLRLQKLGYSSHLVPTEIDGQRWYKVEVGPYATAVEATDAEAELREKYNVAYRSRANGNSVPTTAGDNSKE